MRRLMDSAASTGWSRGGRRQDCRRRCSTPCASTASRAATSGRWSTAATSTLGVNPRPCPVDATIIVWEWGPIWARTPSSRASTSASARGRAWRPNTLPAMAKGTANYANSELIKMEAIARRLRRGHRARRARLISEGSGQNLFLVRDRSSTPRRSARRCCRASRARRVITLARDLGFEVRETSIPREFLYMADEAFFCGTAVEITPIRSIDKITVGVGRARAGDRGAAAALLRHPAGRPPRHARLADPGGRDRGRPPRQRWEQRL